ncbi:hypothetical protein ACOSQ3_022876 [Xanthoceras sorbifolium]
MAETVGPQIVQFSGNNSLAECPYDDEPLLPWLFTSKGEFFFNRPAKPAFFGKNKRKRAAINNSLRASFFTTDLGGSSTVIVKKAREDDCDGSVDYCDDGGIVGDCTTDDGSGGVGEKGKSQGYKRDLDLFEPFFCNKTSMERMIVVISLC